MSSGSSRGRKVLAWELGVAESLRQADAVEAQRRRDEALARQELAAEERREKVQMNLFERGHRSREAMIVKEGRWRGAREQRLQRQEGLLCKMEFLKRQNEVWLAEAADLRTEERSKRAARKVRGEILQRVMQQEERREECEKASISVPPSAVVAGNQISSPAPTPPAGPRAVAVPKAPPAPRLTPPSAISPAAVPAPSPLPFPITPTPLLSSSSPPRLLPRTPRSARAARPLCGALTAAGSPPTATATATVSTLAVGAAAGAVRAPLAPLSARGVSMGRIVGHAWATATAEHRQS